MMAARRIQDTYSVFVGQLSSDVTKNDLRELFQGCGSIADIVVMEDKNRTRKNFAFVRFLDSSSAFRAASELNGWVVKGAAMMVDISKDTAEKIKQEKGIQSSKIRPLKSTSTRKNPIRSHDHAKDTMYLNRLKDSLTSCNLKFSSDQVNCVRLLNDLGPISSFCPASYASVEKLESFEKVSAKIMEKCKKNDTSKVFGKEKAEEFRKALQIIVSEISHVIDPNTLSNTTSQPDTTSQSDESKTIFDQHVIPKSVRIIQKLEKYSEKVTNTSVTKPENVTEKCDNTDVKGNVEKVSKEELSAGGKLYNNRHNVFNTGVMTDVCPCQTQTLETKQHKLFEHSDKVQEGVYKPGLLDYHLSKLKVNTPEGNQNDADDKTTIDNDPLEMLYRKMCASNPGQAGVMVRSSSRDSSISDDSIEGIIDDSGVECDTGVGGMSLTVTSVMKYECNRAEGRARPTADYTPGQIYQQQHTQHNPTEEFSLENYVLKSIGRGRGVPVCSTQIVGKPKGRGIFSGINH